MRIVAAAVLAGLAIAAPAAAFPGNDVTRTIHVGHLVITKTGAVVDKSRSCQAGTKESSKANLLGNTKRPAVVACEQPPRSEVLTPDKVAKATAAALGILG